MSRRDFMRRTGAVAALSFVPAWLPRVAFAQTDRKSRDILLAIFLRGGADGLTLCAPFGDPGYYALRPNLALAPPDSSHPQRLLNLDGFFGLPKPMEPLLPAYQNGELTFVHACGLTDGTRSHFEAQQYMESGLFGVPSSATGWVGRHLFSTTSLTPGAPIRALSTTVALPTSFGGATQAIPVADPGAHALSGLFSSRLSRKYNIDLMYKTSSLAASAKNSIAVIDLLDKIDFNSYAGEGVTYPETVFGRSMKAAAALIRANVGVEAIEVDLGGWDTHNQQGTQTGQMASQMGVLAAGLGAFYQDIFGSYPRNVIVVVMSEFGRVAYENASLGTDHGHGNAMMVLGRKLRGRQIHGAWPGLGEGQLYEGQDLKVTTDYRDVLSEIVSKRLGNPNLAQVFPNYTPRFAGVLQ